MNAMTRSSFAGLGLQQKESLAARVLVALAPGGYRDVLLACLARRGHAITCADSLNGILASLKPATFDLAVIDPGIVRTAPAELTRVLRKAQPRLLLILVSAADPWPGERGFAYAADLAVARCVPSACSGCGESAPVPIPCPVQLTRREKDVLARVVEGHSNKNIAHELGISPRTVELHRARIMQKTGTRNVAQLVRLALSLPRETEPPVLATCASVQDEQQLSLDIGVPECAAKW